MKKFEIGFLFTVIDLNLSCLRDPVCFAYEIVSSPIVAQLFSGYLSNCRVTQQWLSKIILDPAGFTCVRGLTQVCRNNFKLNLITWQSQCNNWNNLPVLLVMTASLLKLINSLFWISTRVKFSNDLKVSAAILAILLLLR